MYDTQDQEKSVFHSYRRQPAASNAAKCALCGQPLPVQLDVARAPASLCDSCARPVRLGGVRAPRTAEKINAGLAEA
jgi:hypothetical protein